MISLHHAAPSINFQCTPRVEPCRLFRPVGFRDENGDLHVLDAEWVLPVRKSVPLLSSFEEAEFSKPLESGSNPGKTVKWHKPSKGWTKINSDGAFQQGKASCGGVLRDSEGSIVIAYGRYIGETKKYSSFTALEAELIGIMDGIDLASAMGLQKVWLESDSSIAVDMVKNFRIDAAPFLCCAWKNTLAKIKGISDFKVSHIYREGNTVADSLAANAFYEKVPRVLTMDADQVPAYITKKAEADASGRVYWRFK